MRFVVRLLYVAVLVFVTQVAGAEELRLGVGAQRVINLPAPITRIVVGQGGIICPVSYTHLTLPTILLV